MAKCQTQKHQTNLDGACELMEKICREIPAINTYTGGIIRYQGKGKGIKLNPDEKGENIILVYRNNGTQKFYLIRDRNTEMSVVLSEVANVINNYDSQLLSLAEQKIKKERVKKMEKPVDILEIPAEGAGAATQEPIVPNEKNPEKELHEEGLLVALETLEDFQDRHGFAEVKNLVNCMIAGGKEIESIFDNIFSQMTPRPVEINNQSAVSFLQKQIEYLESVHSDLRKEIQVHSENEMRLNSSCKKLLTDIDAIEKKQEETHAIEVDAQHKIQELVVQGKYDEVSSFNDSAKSAKAEFQRLQNAIVECKLELQKKQEEKIELTLNYTKLQAKKSATSQAVEILKKACGALSKTIMERFAIIDAQPVSAKVSETETATAEISKEPELTLLADLPTDDIFSGFSEEQKQLLLALETKGKYAGMGSDNTSIADQFAKKNIPKSKIIVIAAQGLETLEKFFQEKGIKPMVAEKFIKGLQKTKILNPSGKIDFDRIKFLLSDKRKYTSKKLKVTKAEEKSKTLPKNGSRQPVSFSDGKSVKNFEAD